MEKSLWIFQRDEKQAVPQGEMYDNLIFHVIEYNP